MATGVRREFGSTELFTVSLTGVEDAHATHSKDSEPKGIKAHFHMTDSGILALDKVRRTSFRKRLRLIYNLMDEFKCYFSILLY